MRLSGAVKSPPLRYKKEMNDGAEIKHNGLY